MRITQFFDAMTKELDNNRYKQGWNLCSIGYLRTRLQQEVEELKRAIEQKESKERIVSEAADVANFCFMIADMYEVE